MSECNGEQVLNNPEFLYVVDKNGQSKKLSLNKIEKLFGIKWLEWDTSDIKFIKCSTQFDDISFPDVNEFLNKLEVRYMGKQYGWGLFSRDYIKKGSVIGVFTGVISFQERNKYITSEHVFISDAPDNKFLIIDGTTCGNITRFLQHLPNMDSIENYWFDNVVDKTNIAVENVEVAIVELFGESVQTNLFIASRSINPNEIIGCAYDPASWESSLPAIFNKNGTVIDQKFYQVLGEQFKPTRSVIPIYVTSRHLR
jgi:hypothetical protein